MTLIYTKTKRQGHQLMTLQVTHTPAMIAPLVDNVPQYSAFWPVSMPTLPSAPQRAATDVVARIMRSRIVPAGQEIMPWLWMEMYAGCGYVISPVYSDGFTFIAERDPANDDSQLVGWLVCDVQRVHSFGGEWDCATMLDRQKQEIPALGRYAGDGIYRVALFRSAICESCAAAAPFSRTDWPGVVMPLSCVIFRDGQPVGPAMASLLRHYVTPAAAELLDDWRDY